MKQTLEEMLKERNMFELDNDDGDTFVIVLSYLISIIDMRKNFDEMAKSLEQAQTDEEIQKINLELMQYDSAMDSVTNIADNIVVFLGLKSIFKKQLDTNVNECMEILLLHSKKLIKEYTDKISAIKE